MKRSGGNGGRRRAARRMTFTAAAFSCLLALAAGCGGEDSADLPEGARVISLDDLHRRVRGGWAGQMIGVSFGAPTEFRALGKVIQGEIPWSPERVAIAIRQDDLYVEMTFARVMDTIGLDATTEQYGEAFRDTQYRLWHANAGARKALNRGIKAPDSGTPKHNMHANDIDFQIEADFIGLMCPGLPAESNKYCDRVGRVMNHGDGVYGGMFVCGMYSAAFFETDPRKVVEAGLACLPPASGYAKVIRDTLDLAAEHPSDWVATWTELNRRWDRHDSCPEGALGEFNIDARLNGAYIAIGLLYGGGDFTQTVEISTRCGQDSDCNPSNAAGILGVMIGYDAIPDRWKSGIEAVPSADIVGRLSEPGYDSTKWTKGKPTIAQIRFDYTNYSFDEIVESTVKRAIRVAESVGGRLDGKRLIIPRQEPSTPELEQWQMGVAGPLARFGGDGWKLEGEWREVQTQQGGPPAYVGDKGGLTATLDFEGDAVCLVGYHREDGGRADVSVDGKPAGTLDAYLPANTTDMNLWHAYGLGPGPHTLTIRTRDDRAAASSGNIVIVIGAIPFTASTE